MEQPMMPPSNGECIVCLRPTDTALAFASEEPEWLAAGLSVLGLPEDEAMSEVRRWLDGIPEDEHVSWLEMPVRVCGDCVAKCRANFPAPVLAVGDWAVIPTITQL